MANGEIAGNPVEDGFSRTRRVLAEIAAERARKRERLLMYFLPPVSPEEALVEIGRLTTPPLAPLESPASRRLRLLEIAVRAVEALERLPR